jgi:hypothetical protein
MFVFDGSEANPEEGESYLEIIKLFNNTLLRHPKKIIIIATMDDHIELDTFDTSKSIAKEFGFSKNYQKQSFDAQIC